MPEQHSAGPRRYADPVELFHAALTAMRAEGWAAFAALCDPVSLRAFHQRYLARYAPSNNAASLMSADDIQRSVPDMPREVAEYQARQLARLGDGVARLARELPSVHSIEALEAMPADELFALWLDSRSRRRQVERLVAEGRAAPEVLEHSSAIAGMQTFVALGALPDGDRITHVVYRRDAMPLVTAEDTKSPNDDRLNEERQLARELFGRTPTYTVQCRRQPDDGWLLVADEQMMHFGNTVMVGIGRVDKPAAAS